MDDLDPSSPFLRSHGLAAGIAQHTLDGPAYRTLLRGVVVGAGVPVTAEVRLAPHCWSARLRSSATTRLPSSGAGSCRTTPGHT